MSRYAGISVPITVVAECDNCHKELSASVGYQNEQITVSVEPCTLCRSHVETENYQKGFQEGREDAQAEAETEATASSPNFGQLEPDTKPPLGG